MHTRNLVQKPPEPSSLLKWKEEGKKGRGIKGKDKSGGKWVKCYYAVSVCMSGRGSHARAPLENRVDTGSIKRLFQSLPHGGVKGSLLAKLLRKRDGQK